MSELSGWLASLPEISGTEEEIMAQNGKKLSKLAGNWLVNHLFKHLNDSKSAIADSPITAENFAEFLTLLYANKINNTIGQQILETMFKTGEAPTEIMIKGNLGQIDDSAELERIIDGIVAAN